MSDAYGDGASGADELDLSETPMDVIDDDDANLDGEGEEEGVKPGARTPLAPEELEKRYTSTKTALAEERRARRSLEARLDAIERGTRPAAEQRQMVKPEADIDPEDDPIGALRQMKAKIAAYEKAEAQENQSVEERRAEERKVSQIETRLSEHEADFRETTPDYDKAAAHYAASRARELFEFGLTPAQVQPMLRKEFADLASNAMNARKNPAAVVYNLAKGRGFGVAAADPKDPKGGKARTTGKIDALLASRKGESPLARSGGGGAKSIDAETVANINIRDKKGGDDFDKAFAQLERDAKAASRGR